VLGLLSLEVELHVLQFFQILVLDLLSEGLFFGSDFFGLSAVFFFDSFDHVVEFFEVVVMGLLHFASFSQKLSL
jgi:hypothetical protein